MTDWIFLSALIAAASSLGFAALALLWLRRTKKMLRTVLGETAMHQVNTANRLSEAIRRLQIQNQDYGEQIVVLSRACQQLRQDIQTLNARQATMPDSTHNSPTIH